MSLRVNCNHSTDSVCLCGTDDLRQANAFLHALKLQGFSIYTRRAYAYDLLCMYRWLHRHHLALEGLNQAMLLDFVAFQRDACAKPRSINRRLVSLRRFYGFVFDRPLPSAPGTSRLAPHYKGSGYDRRVGHLPIRRRREGRLMVKVPHTVVEPLTPDQISVFLGTLRRYRDLAIAYFMLFCGLRSQEVRAVRLSDLNVSAQTVRVRGKGSRERMMPLPRILIAVITDYLRLERPSPTRTDHLFVVLQGNHRGEPLTAPGMRQLFRHRRKQHAAIRMANAHRFRHTFAADLARTGVNLPVLQRLMGHADPRTTLHYIHLSLADISAEFARALRVIETRYSDDLR